LVEPSILLKNFKKLTFSRKLLQVEFRPSNKTKKR